MHEKISFRLTGITPLMLNNSRLADPLDDIAKQMKKVTSKRQKTEDDHLKIQYLEWMGSLYLDENRRIVIPGENIESMLIKSAKARKLGQQFTAGVISDGMWPIRYNGPKDPDKVYEAGGFVDRRSAKPPGQGRVLRTRPIFRDWSVECDVHFDPDLIDAEQVIDRMNYAGTHVAIGNYRPRFGRFQTEVLNGTK